MAFGLVTHTDSVRREDLLDTLKYGYGQFHATDNGEDDRQDFDPKEHPLYRILKDRKEDQSDV